MASEWYVLFRGLLTDAPGRNESWEEQIRYLGASRWHLRSVGTDFYGNESGDIDNERMGTKSMIRWVNDRDYEDQENDARFQQHVDDSLEEGGNVLGSRGIRLKEVAMTVDATFCVDLLEQWENGTWPKAPSPPRVKDVLGVAKRGVWIRVYHVVYRVSTTKGGAYLYPQSEDGTSRLVLATNSPFDQGWRISPSRRVLSQMEALDGEFERLMDEKKGKRQLPTESTPAHETEKG